jgi:hypothetical protein
MSIEARNWGDSNGTSIVLDVCNGSGLRSKLLSEQQINCIEQNSHTLTTFRSNSSTSASVVGRRSFPKDPSGSEIDATKSKNSGPYRGRVTPSCLTMGGFLLKLQEAPLFNEWSKDRSLPIARA